VLTAAEYRVDPTGGPTPEEIQTLPRGLGRPRWRSRNL